MKMIFKYPKTFLILISAMVFFPILGGYPLLCQWEPHYGRVAMEMMAISSWDWFLDPVYLGKHNFWSKPIFCFWMVFPFMKVLGPTELALRLPFAINGVLFVLLIYHIARRLFNDVPKAFTAGFIAIFTPFTYLISRQFMWDITFVTFLTGSIGFLYLGQRDSDKRTLRLAYLFMGLGMLTKGLLAVFFPAAIIALWMMVITDYSGGFRKTMKDYGAFIKSLRPCEGTGIFIAVSGWWYLYMYIKHGMPFYNEFFGEHHFGRLEGTIDKPDGPFEFYVWQLSIGAFPWIGFLVPALYFTAKKLNEKKSEAYVILSFFFMFMFFTLTATKFPHYIFPVIPFMSMILAVGAFELFSDPKLPKYYPVTAVIAALIVGIIGKDLATGLNYADILYIITTHKVQTWFGRVFDMRFPLEIFTPVMVVFILVPMVALSKKWLYKLSVAGFILTAVAWAGYLNFYWVPRMLDVFTPKKLVEKYFELKKDGDVIVDYDNWKNRSMYFYLGLNETLHRVDRIDQVQKIVKDHPENKVFITTKVNKVSELRAALLNDPGVTMTKIMDDAVDTYMEIEMYSVSVKDKDSPEANKWRENIIDEAEIPSNIERVNGTLGDGTIEIIGYKLNSNRFDPGADMRIIIYYRVLKPIEKSWKVFFHFDVYSGALPHSWKFDDYPLQGFYPTNKWEVGQIIRDEFNTVVPKAHPGGGVKIYTGFYINNERMNIDKESFNDGQKRFILGTFNVNIK